MNDQRQEGQGRRLPGERYAYDKGGSPWELVLSVRWEPWKRQTAAFFAALTQRQTAYRMVIVGGLLSAASVFIMALPTAWFGPLAAGLLLPALGGPARGGAVRFPQALRATRPARS